jgi:hypothetical protein
MNPLICGIVTAFIHAHVAPIDSPAPADICTAAVVDICTAAPAVCKVPPGLDTSSLPIRLMPPIVRYDGLPRPWTMYLSTNLEVMTFSFADGPAPSETPPPSPDDPPNEMFRDYHPDDEIAQVCTQFTYNELLEMQFGSACLKYRR